MSDRAFIIEINGVRSGAGIAIGVGTAGRMIRARIIDISDHPPNWFRGVASRGVQLHERSGIAAAVGPGGRCPLRAGVVSGGRNMDVV